MQSNTSIFLIGYMGSGKTTLGKWLSNQLDFDFIDSDLSIAEEQQTSILEIFEKYGEGKFRELEKDWLNSWNPKKSTLVATGGGLPCFHENLVRMKALGKVVYLQLPVAALVSRLSTSRKGISSRPLLVDKNPEELLSHIQVQLIEREVFYTQADLIINPLETIKTQILSKIQMLFE